MTLIPTMAPVHSERLGLYRERRKGQSGGALKAPSVGENGKTPRLNTQIVKVGHAGLWRVRFIITPFVTACLMYLSACSLWCSVCVGLSQSRCRTLWLSVQVSQLRTHSRLYLPAYVTLAIDWQHSESSNNTDRSHAMVIVPCLEVHSE